MTTRTDRNQTWGASGELVEDEVVEVDVTEWANRSTIEAAVRDHLADLRTIRNSNGTLTGEQLSNAVRALAKGQGHVVRLLIGALDSTD